MTAGGPVPPEDQGPDPLELPGGDDLRPSAAEGHLGWRVSALLDGELPTTEELVAREHLAGCDRCQEEFAQVMAARSFVRGLGEVEPPRDFLDRLAASGAEHTRIRFGLVALVGIAALWIVLLIIGAGVAVPQVVPPVDDFVHQHEVASSDPELLPTLEPVEVLDPSADGVDAPYVLPDELASGFTRVVAYDKGGGVIQALYRSGDSQVSLFQQEGTLDWSDLPADGEERTIGDQRAWVTTVDADAGTGQVIVVPDGPVVYTLVASGPESTDAAFGLVPVLPEPQDYSWIDRARHNVDRVTDRLGLD